MAFHDVKHYGLSINTGRLGPVAPNLIALVSTTQSLAGNSRIISA